VINAHHKKTGKKVMFAFNISGTIEQMAARHDMVTNWGAPV
jgi:ribulose 1,5-bisphosphate carboxylase large subunit-like protein